MVTVAQKHSYMLSLTWIKHTVEDSKYVLRDKNHSHRINKGLFLEQKALLNLHSERLKKIQRQSH